MEEPEFTIEIEIFKVKDEKRKLTPKIVAETLMDALSEAGRDERFWEEYPQFKMSIPAYWEKAQGHKRFEEVV